MNVTYEGPGETTIVIVGDLESTKEECEFILSLFPEVGIPSNEVDDELLSIIVKYPYKSHPPEQELVQKVPVLFAAINATRLNALKRIFQAMD
jgi:hypothetical protein